jgi:hypothetical protein
MYYLKDLNSKNTLSVHVIAIPKQGSLLLLLLAFLAACQSESPGTAAGKSTSVDLKAQAKPVVESYLDQQYINTRIRLDSVQIIQVDTTTPLTLAKLKRTKWQQQHEYYLTKAQLLLSQSQTATLEAEALLFSGGTASSEKSQEATYLAQESVLYTDTANMLQDSIDQVHASIQQKLIPTDTFIDFYVLYRVFITQPDGKPQDFTNTVRMRKDLQKVIPTGT